MNKINLINSSAHLTKYDIFSMYRSTWLRDALCVYVLGPLSLFGAFFNLISMIILYRKKFKSRPLYTYLKVFTLNSLCLNLIELGVTSALSFRYIEFSYKSRLPSFFMCYVYMPFINILILNSIILEIYISIERNSQFSAKFKYFFLNYSPVKVCLATFMACFAMNFQHFFVSTPITGYHVINSKEMLKINFFKLNKFSTSLPVLIINSLVYMFRDFLLFLVQICFNIITTVLLKNHLNNKNIILKRSEQSENLLINTKIMSQSKIDQNLSIMVMLMTLFTAFEHLFLLTMIILLTFYGKNKSILFAMIANIVISFKHGSNFFLYLSFNKVFRIEFKKFIGIDAEK